MILRQALEQDVVSLGQLGIVEQVRLRDGEQQLDVGVERVVQRVVAVESEDPEVDVGPGERSFEHREANADALQPHGVGLLLWYVH